MMKLKDKKLTPNRPTIRIAIADDHQLFRQSLIKVLESFSDIEIVLEVSSGNELQKALAYTNVDVILMDIYMPKQNGLVTCKEILKKYPNAKVIALTAFVEREIILRMIDLGACGFLTKNTNLNELYRGIVEVYDGGYYFENSLNELLNPKLKEGHSKRVSSRTYTAEFSETELEILKLVCNQFTNKEISKKLNISIRTIETHRRKLIEKTQSKNMIGVVIYAFQIGVMDFSKFRVDAWDFIIRRRGIA